MDLLGQIKDGETIRREEDCFGKKIQSTQARKSSKNFRIIKLHCTGRDVILCSGV